MNVERIGRRLVACTGALLLAASMAAATEPAPTPARSPGAGHSVGVAERPEGAPIFFRWLDKNAPVDATILEYWKRYESGKLTPKEMVDLGTMLFKRGWPKDAVRLYEEAGKADPALYDAWLRAGLVEHSMRKLGPAKKYYKKCLKVLVGNGWCNFYMGLAEEQTYNGSAALRYYEKAFKVAPDLADPRTNPAVLQSRIARAAAVAKEKQSEFVKSMPMSYLQPEEVNNTRAKYENRQRKIEMWEDRAAGEQTGVSRPNVPHAVSAGATRETHQRGVAVHPTPHAGPSAHNVRTTPHHRPNVSVPYRTPASASGQHAPAPPAHKAPAPSPASPRTSYPWGGSPLPPPVAPGQKPVAATPVPHATPTPGKKKE